ncbi:TIGR01459 family HAD-type hydrolase [Muricoccus radiodurans]|uniref:TIGR01459 family HAD-type hydrolase n=1 Tax=Muricoccus radiodurans TaxID=2231721 RepID=UPI003CEB631E
MRILDGVAELARRYRGFILDIWGVVHDGHALFPGVADALARLHGAGARIVFLTNAPRRSSVVEAQLTRLGVDRAHYVTAMSSGEITWRLLRDRTRPYVAALGPRVHAIGIHGDLSVADLGFTVVTSPEEADWVLNTGPDPERGRLDLTRYQPELDACRARDLPMICVNPDRRVVSGGRLLLCAGALSERYAEMGGRTLEVGKPDPATYPHALEPLALPKDAVVAIGDSPHTDLAGAQAAGLDAIWALGGLAAEEGLGTADSETLAARALAEGVAPLAALRALRW